MEHGIDFEDERKRLTRWAWGVTIGYGCVLSILAVLVLFGEEGLDSFRRMSPNEVGDLLAGIAGPVAFIWLVYGYFLQGIAIRQQSVELQQNTKALNLQAEELKNSVEQQREVALAANKQAEAMRDSQKPVFAVMISVWTGNGLDLSIINSGQPANNIFVQVSLGGGDPVDRYIPHLPAQSSTGLSFADAIHPSMRIALRMSGQYFVSLRYDYGNGFHDVEIFDFVTDESNHQGRFVNRKTLLDSTAQ